MNRRELVKMTASAAMALPLVGTQGTARVFATEPESLRSPLFLSLSGTLLVPALSGDEHETGMFHLIAMRAPEGRWRMEKMSEFDRALSRSVEFSAPLPDADELLRHMVGIHRALEGSVLVGR
jgi:hypothetical protein